MKAAIVLVALALIAIALMQFSSLRLSHWKGHGGWGVTVMVSCLSSGANANNACEARRHLFSAETVAVILVAGAAWFLIPNGAKTFRWCGRTKYGAYVCRKEADAAGDRDTRNGQ